jgi:hypothetical protein
MRTKIRRKNTKAGVRWYVFVVNEDGSESAHPAGGFDRQRDAKAAAEEVRTDARRGRYVAPTERSLADYLLGEWLPSRRPLAEHARYGSDRRRGVDPPARRRRPAPGR